MTTKFFIPWSNISSKQIDPLFHDKTIFDYDIHIRELGLDLSFINPEDLLAFTLRMGQYKEKDKSRYYY